MQVNSSGITPDASHAFYFDGNGQALFKIHIVNIFFIIITGGLYIPWAWVRSRGYIYHHMKLNRAHFSYHLPGSALFISLCLWTLLALVLIVLAINGALPLALMLTLVIILLLPVLLIKGIDAQAMHTSLNNLRFRVQCPVWQTLWVLLALPLVLILAIHFLTNASGYFVPMPLTVTGIISHVVIVNVLSTLFMAAGAALFYLRWLRLLVNHTWLGGYAFSLRMPSWRGSGFFFQAGAIHALFLAVTLVGVLTLFFSARIEVSAEGSIALDSLLEAAGMHWGQLAGYLLFYLLGLGITYAFLLCRLRNLLINSLALGEHLTLRSTLTFSSLVGPVLLLWAATLATAGLAWPWAKVRLLRLLASRTVVCGDLALLAEQGDEASAPPEHVNLLARGLLPWLPFI